jgi:CRP/FNR family transcriptional regulator, cyclic AMP receptor protein
MISDAVAPLASAVWMAMTMSWRSATRRRYAVDTAGRRQIKPLHAPALRTLASSMPDNRMSSTRDAHLAVVEPDRMIDHPHRVGRGTCPDSWDVYQALIASGVFSKIDPVRVFAASERLEPLRFSPGAVMDAQSDYGGRIYVIISGRVKVVHRRLDGNEMVLTILGPSEIYGAIALFDPGACEIAGTALTEVVAVPIECDRFLSWVAESPEFSEQLLRLFARWVKASTNSLVDFAFADAESRVANQVLCLRKRFGQREGEAVRVTHELTLEDFSNLVGVPPETVDDTLRRFELRGWIRLEDKSLVVVDAHALASVPHSSTSEVHCA